MITVIRGGKKDFTLDIEKGDDPYDLTNATEIKVCMPGESATQELTLTGAELVIDNAVLGKISGTIPAAKSALLAVGEEQTIEVRVVISGGDPDVSQIESALTVVETIC